MNKNIKNARASIVCTIQRRATRQRISLYTLLNRRCTYTLAVDLIEVFWRIFSSDDLFVYERSAIDDITGAVMDPHGLFYDVFLSRLLIFSKYK